MRAVAIALSLLAVTHSTAFAAAPRPSTSEATMGSLAAPRSPGGPGSPLEERSRAFESPLHFRSRGNVQAMLFKFNRDMKIRMVPVREEGQLKAMATTVVDVAGGGKVYRGTLPFSPRGTLRSTEPKLVNACNILGIDPAMRERLKAGFGPITVKGQIETEGAVRIVTITHRLSGKPQEDGTVVIESTTVSDDGGVNLSTRSTMAKDGLPLHAETTGTVKKGPIDVDVNIQLTREDAAEEE